MKAITAFPLCWPLGKPRTKHRKSGKFSERERVYGSEGGGSWTRARDLTIAEACKRMQAELDRIGATEIVLSTNVETRGDGLPRSRPGYVSDPGVALYFKLKGKPHCLPCDSYTEVAQNIAAIAAHIDATRAIERYGVADLAAMFAGFTALPSPETASAPHWRTVLGLAEDENTIEAVKLAYRRRARETHPDHGGTVEQFDLVQRAWEMAQQEIGA